MSSEKLTTLNNWILLAAYVLLGSACASGENNPSSNASDNGEIAIDSQTPAMRFVTITDNEAGWWILDGQSDWISPDCRQSIESRGGAFTLVQWAEIEGTTQATDSRSCDELSSAYFTGNTQTNNQIAQNTYPLSRGINLAGDFEVEPRGAWGAPIDEDAFMRIAAAGFDHVRIPIRWSSYTGTAPRYQIDETFFLEVDRLLELANESNLGIVVNVHFFEELEENPAGERARFLAIWNQIAIRYENEPNSVVFELLNEPIGEFIDNPELWNELVVETLAVIRQSNPDRGVIVGPVQYNHPSRLPDLDLPADNNLIATIHSYDPIEFTHQGAIFIDPVPATGVVWRPGSASIDFEWLDYSWNTDVTAGPEGLFTEYQSQYAAIAMRADIAQSYQRLIIEADRAYEAVVVCNFLAPPATNIEIEFTGTTGTADISSCGDVASLGIQLAEPDPLAVTLTRLALCNSGCEEIIVTQLQALDKQISTAASWAADRGVPLYLGEFGTLDPVNTPTDPQSRADWTRSMRTIAESYGVGWAYFAHDDEFGAYDRETGQWVPIVLEALID